MRTRKHIKVIKGHRTSTVYLDGRYLHVDMKISTRSRRGREIARETARDILNEVGSSEMALDIMHKTSPSAVADPPVTSMQPTTHV